MQKTLQNVGKVFPLSSFIAQKSRIPKSNRWTQTIYGITFSRKQASRILFNQFMVVFDPVKVEQKLIPKKLREVIIWWIKKEFPCSKFWLSPMRLKELNSKFSKTTGLETEADFRVWGHYIFVKAGIRSCNPLVRLSLGCKEGTRRNGRFGLPSRQAPSGNRHQCPFR